MSNKQKFLQALEKLKNNPRDAKQWARDILADPNYTSDLGKAMAKKALDPNNLKSGNNES